MRRDIQKFAGATTALLAFAAGLLLLTVPSRLGERLGRASYDWSLRLSPAARGPLRDSEVVIVSLDDRSRQALKQPAYKPWDRALQARLLSRLTAEHARAVVWDVPLSEPGPEAKADDSLQQAIQANARVVLAADCAYAPAESQASVTAGRTLILPLDRFLTNAAGWGVAEVTPDDDLVVRRQECASAKEDPDSLVWAAARLINLPLVHDPHQRLAERWLSYYGPPGAIPHVSFAEALSPEGVSTGFFRNKIVFVGAGLSARSNFAGAAAFRSPLGSGGRRSSLLPAVEVEATALLNLIRDDWLRRLEPPVEAGVLLLTAALFGFGLARLKPLAATAVAGAGTVAVVAAAAALLEGQRLWFPWLIVVAVQAPLCLAGRFGFHSVARRTQRRELERERARDHRQAREQAELLEKAQDAAWVVDLDGYASYWNPSAERLYGWPAAEVLHHDLKKLLLPPDHEQAREAREAVLKAGRWAGELSLKTKAGATVIVQSRWSLVLDGLGNPKSVLVIDTDVTHQKKLEGQFLQAQRLESIGALAGGIAHDLNNVLSPILMGVDLLQTRVHDELCQKMLRTMSASAKRGADMARQVMTFAHGQEGERMELQISHLIRELSESAQGMVPASIKIQTRVGDQLWPILGDPTQLRQVILNLCLNARDAMPDGGVLLIEARNVRLTEADAKRLLGAKPIDYVMLSVSDSGAGLPPEVMDKIFEPFFTIKTGSRGAGLGLSTAFSIVKGHWGLVDVNSELGKGTTFNVYLPAARNAGVASAGATPPERLMGKNELILLVDDEVGITEIAASVLSNYDYRVMTANTGMEAIALCTAQREHIDLALVDMMMPELDGPATIRALRKLQPDLRFVMITGLHEGEKTNARFGDEPVTFLIKPFSIEQLTETVKTALASPVPAPAAVPPIPTTARVALPEKESERRLAARRPCRSV